MSNYTPGPWRITGPNVRANDALISVITDHWANVSTDETEKKANARLIAAAPDLLEALKGLHDDIMDYIRLNSLGAENNHWLVQARAAIAKATGEQA